MIDCVVAPFDHTLFVADEEVSVTDPPAQNVVDPLAVIVGVAGIGFTVTGIVFETPDEHPAAVTTAE